MKTTTEYLDALRARFMIGSDYGIAAMLHESRFRVSNYRTGKATFSDEMAIKVAALLELHPAIVLLSVQAERARRQHQGEVYAALAAVVECITRSSPPFPLPPDNQPERRSRVKCAEFPAAASGKNPISI